MKNKLLFIIEAISLISILVLSLIWYKNPTGNIEPITVTLVTMIAIIGFFTKEPIRAFFSKIHTPTIKIDIQTKEITTTKNVELKKLISSTCEKNIFNYQIKVVQQIGIEDYAKKIKNIDNDKYHEALRHICTYEEKNDRTKKEILNICTIYKRHIIKDMNTNDMLEVFKGIVAINYFSGFMGDTSSNLVVSFHNTSLNASFKVNINEEDYRVIQNTTLSTAKKREEERDLFKEMKIIEHYNERGFFVDELPKEIIVKFFIPFYIHMKNIRYESINDDYWYIFAWTYSMD